MNNFKCSKDSSSILDFDVKSEIYVKEELFVSDNENNKDYYSGTLEEQTFGSSFDVSNIMNTFSKDPIKTEDVNEVCVEKMVDDLHQIKTEESEIVYAETLDEGDYETKISNMKNSFNDAQEQVVKINSSVSWNSLNVKTEDGENMKASCSQEGSQMKKIFLCSVCNYQTNAKGNFNRHLLTHSDIKLFKCSKCDYGCNEKSGLRRHMLIHSKTKSLKCAYCDYESNRKGDLNNHLLIHSNLKLFKCSECDYECNQKRNLKIHSITHSKLKLFKCSECDYECNHKNSLKIHLLTHSSLKLFKCSECDYECNYKSSLKTHLLTHSKSYSRVKSKLLFKCSECDYECNLKSHLKRHLLTHFNSKMFKCSECDYECNYKNNLKRHLLAHSK